MAVKTIQYLSHGTLTEMTTGVSQSFNATGGDLLVVAIGGGGASSSNNRPTAVSFNGDPLTQYVIQNYNNTYAQIYYLLKPDQGNYTVAVTVNTPSGSNYWCPFLYKNVLAASGQTGNNTGSGTTPNVTINTSVGDLVVDMLGHSTVAKTATGDNTPIIDATRYGASYAIAAGASVYMEWTLDASVDRTIVGGGFTAQPLRSGLVTIFGGGYGIGHGGRPLFPGTIAKIKGAIAEVKTQILKPTPAQALAFGERN